MKKAKSLTVGNGAHKSTDVGPLISPEAKERAVRLITGGIHQARRLSLCSVTRLRLGQASFAVVHHRGVSTGRGGSLMVLQQAAVGAQAPSTAADQQASCAPTCMPLLATSLW